MTEAGPPLAATNGAHGKVQGGPPLPEEQPPNAAPVPGPWMHGPVNLIEPLFYVVLTIAAASTRLWDLGLRAYHHDESLHAYYSWVLYTGGGFMHNPLMHGPLLFHVTALGYFLFGDNLTAPRVFPALFGTALVLMPLLLRDRLGKYGTMATCLLIAISPSMFYFSRFIREDIFTLVFELGFIMSIWRYIDTRKNRYLYTLAASLALLFSTKETSYITLAMMGSFLVLWWAQGIGLQWSRKLFRRQAAPSAPNTGPPDRKAGFLTRLPPQAGMALLMGTLVLPLVSALLGFLAQHFGGGVILVNGANNWQSGAVGSPVGGQTAFLIAGVIAISLFAFSVLLGLAWKPGIWGICFAVFWGIFLFLHTTMFTNMVGVGSGVWQGLAYWISQQSVERGGQPWYYYLIMLPLYETLPFAIGIIACAIAIGRLGERYAFAALFIAAAAGLLAAAIYTLTGTKALYAPLAVGFVLLVWLALRSGADVFDWFLIYWVGMTFILYVVAGEKMPWLITHMALPLAFLSGKYMGRMLVGLDWGSAARSGGPFALVLVPVVLLAIRAMTLSAQWHRMPLGIWAFVVPLIVAVGAILLGVWLWMRVGRGAFLRLAALSTIALLGLFTIRSGFEAAFVHSDVPVEMLVYTQTSPEVGDFFRQVDQTAKETGKGKDLHILIDTGGAGFGWPAYWYLRNYKHVDYRTMNGMPAPIDADVVVLDASDQGAMAASRERFTTGRTIPFRQWFPESYRGYTVNKFLDDFYKGSSWSKMLNYYTYRKLGEPLGHTDVVVYWAKPAAS